MIVSRDSAPCRAVEHTVSAAFTAGETFDVGVDLVSLDGFERRPFAFDGTIDEVCVELK